MESTGPFALVLSILHEHLSLALELGGLVVAALLVELLGLDHRLLSLADVLLGLAVVSVGLLKELLALTLAE